MNQESTTTTTDLFVFHHLDKQLSIYFEKKLLEFQRGFRKGFSTQYCLLLMLEKWIRPVDIKNVFKALRNDLSKAFNCISQHLLIDKLTT